MKPGDVVWVAFPSGAGRAQHGRRPAIVAQDELASASLPTLLLIPLTTQQDALRFPGTVLIEATPENGLTRASIALVFQTSAVDVSFVDPPVGHISSQMVEELRLALTSVTFGMGVDGDSGESATQRSREASEPEIAKNPRE